MKSEKIVNKINFGLQLNLIFETAIKKIIANMNGGEVGLVRNNRKITKTRAKLKNLFLMIHLVIK